MHLIYNQALENLILKKLREKNQISEKIKSIKLEHFFFKEVVTAHENQQLSQENIDYNLKEREKLQKFMAKHLNDHKIITKETSVYYNQLQEAESFQKIANIYS